MAAHLCLPGSTVHHPIPQGYPPLCELDQLEMDPERQSTKGTHHMHQMSRQGIPGPKRTDRTTMVPKLWL